MSRRTPTQVPQEVAHNVGHDVSIDREQMSDMITHDYSTSQHGIVPLDRRRPLWHFLGIWTTLAGGFSFLFVGTQVYEAGFSLWGCAWVTMLGVAMYGLYLLFAAYLGSRTGQTHALLTRSIFGVSGSCLVTLFLIVGPLGLAGFQAGLMVQIWNGLYGWHGVEAMTIIFAVVMIWNNLFGFSGISLFARYVVTPLITLWILYMVFKGLVSGGHLLGAHPANTAHLDFWQIVGFIAGSLMWGNEPDVFRYGKPKLSWPLPAISFALLAGMLLFTVGGWMMAAFSHSTSFGTTVRFSAHYSLFGLLPLAFILATISQFAINDANYYEAINAFQNLLGGWSKWKRVYSCLICAALTGFAGYLVNYVFTNGFFKLASFLSISVPCATVIMCVDHFVLPRMLGISRPLVTVPSWKETKAGNWPAIVALAVTVAFGAYATGLMPGENASTYWGPALLITWALAGVLYIICVAVVRQLVPGATALKSALGFSKLVIDEPYPSSRVVDIASQAEEQLGHEEEPVRQESPAPRLPVVTEVPS